MAPTPSQIRRLHRLQLAAFMAAEENERRRKTDPVAHWWGMA